MKDTLPGVCWICGASADSDEHRRKRSDLVARYGSSWKPEQQPFLFPGDGGRRYIRIQGPNDRKNVYRKILCRPCNNIRVQPADQAYKQFSDWILTNSKTLHSKNTIDFEEIYGDVYGKKTTLLMRYFIKCLGCRIAGEGIKPPTALSQILTDAAGPHAESLAITFGIDAFWRRIDPTGRVVGDDYFCHWPEIADRQCFSWCQTLGYLQIFYWYDLEWDNGYPSGGESMRGSCRSVTLGHHDSLREEEMAAIASLVSDRAEPKT